jgi:hypothetical protein
MKKKKKNNNKILSSSPFGTMAEQKISIVLVTDWRLAVSHGKTYGMCYVKAPDDFKELTFKRGFPLTDPTHLRCALFALVLGMEQVACSRELNSGKMLTMIVTKSKSVLDMCVGARSVSMRRWATDGRVKPLKVAGYSKKFMIDVFDTIDGLHSRGIADIVYVGDEKSPPSLSRAEQRNILTKHTVHLDIDADVDYGSDCDIDDDVRACDIKQRHHLMQELVAHVPRGSRSMPKLSASRRRNIARSEGGTCIARDVADGEKKKDIVGQNKTGGIIDTLNEREKKVVDDATKPIAIHSGLAAAIAAEESRISGDAVSGTTGCGGGAEVAHIARNIQE